MGALYGTNMKSSIIKLVLRLDYSAPLVSCKMKVEPLICITFAVKPKYFVERHHFLLFLKIQRCISDKHVKRKCSLSTSQYEKEKLDSDEVF